MAKASVCFLSGMVPSTLVSLLLASAAIFSPDPAFAADCSQEVLAEGRALAELRKKLVNDLRKLNSRLDGQDLDFRALGSELQAAIPARPAPPELPEDGFGSDGQPVLACSEDGSAGTVPAEMMARLQTAEAEVMAFAEAVKQRRDALTKAAETAAAPGAAVTAGDDADAEAQQQTPETADAAKSATSAEPAATPEGAVPSVEAAAPQDPAAESDAAQPETAVAVARKPLPDVNNPYLSRRIITLPGAAGVADPDAVAEAEDYSTFSVLYVFDSSTVGGEEWLEVARDDDGVGSRWIKRADGLDWSSMLVMSFAPRGKRDPVLFFENDRLLSDTVKSFKAATEVKTIFEGLLSERDKLASDPSYQPQWDDRLVAIEPETAVTYKNDPYLLPILDFRAERFDNGTETMLLKVAAVPADAASVSARDDKSFSSSAARSAEYAGEFRLGIVFVVDTTISMAPFIERTKEAIRNFYDAATGMESGAFVSFGMVGYRDAMKGAPGPDDYVTQVFQFLDPEARPEDVLSTLDGVRESPTNNSGFVEDGIAGLNDAISQMDWSPFNARIIVLIGDASMREGNDPLARDPGQTVGLIRETAVQNGITIIPVHLLTPANTRDGDAPKAEQQFRELAKTGDPALNKYTAVDAATDQAFAAQLDEMSTKLLRAAVVINSGELLVTNAEERPEPIPDLPEAATVPSLADSISHEIFRAQLESLAMVGEGEVPSFLSGWASDRDLGNPDITSLDVGVYLTRAQLSSLDKQIELLIEAFESNVDDPGTFFDRLQALAAETSSDPNTTLDSEREAIETLMPAFLQNLPYRSEVLRLDRPFWTAKSSSEREAFIEALRVKRRVYAELFNTTENWKDFGSGDPSEEATLIPLRNLP